MSSAPPRVERLAPADVIDLRQRILRANRPREDSIYPGDDLPTTRHFGIRDPATATLLACATFQHEPLKGEPAWRLRGMAVDHTVQGTRLGSTLLAAAERELHAIDHSTLLWCNARSTAVGFYERQGWQILGDEFVIEDVGPHFVMSKRMG